MNFTELYKKIHAIDEGTLPVAPTKDDQPMGAGAGDEGMEECGEMPMPAVAMMGKPEGEQDHVSMNVSLNGAGAGGVRSLMDILRNIEQGAEHHAPHHHAEPEEPLMGDMVRSMEEESVGEEYENSVHDHDGAEQYDIDSIMRTGDDLASKGRGALKHNGGENPMHEALVAKLSALYQSIKESEVDEAAKWRDPKYKDKLFTQEPDEDDDYGSDDFYGDSRPENDPGKKHRMGGVGHQYDSDDKLKSYYGGDHGNTTGGEWRGKTSHSPYKDSGVSVKGPRKGLLTKNAIRNVKDRIHGALGKHHEPSLPEGQDKPKTMSRAAKGVMKYGKDGMQALAKAGKEGKDLDKVRDKYNKYD